MTTKYASIVDMDFSQVCTTECNDQGDMFECMECGQSLKFNCDCIYDEEISEIDVYCHVCQATRSDVNCLSLFRFDRDTEEALSLDHWLQDNGHDSWDPAWSGEETSVTRCTHTAHPVEFPDGTVVYASSVVYRKEDDPAPQFGLYLDDVWSPSCLSYVLAWPDMNIPKFKDVACHAIVDTFNKARLGMFVEVGCIGGHGRTGTVLACMASLAGVPWDECVAWVKENYCPKAVETAEQEWFVDFFDKFVRGGETGPEVYYMKGVRMEDLPFVFDDEGFVWEDFNVLDLPAAHLPAPGGVEYSTYTYSSTATRTTDLSELPYDESEAYYEYKDHVPADSENWDEAQWRDWYYEGGGRELMNPVAVGEDEPTRELAVITSDGVQRFEPDDIEEPF